MARKRLRPFLDEVISDVDLRTSVERVAEAAGPVDPAVIVVPADAGEPADVAHTGFAAPPPWESPPALTPLPANETAPPGNGSTNATADPAVTVELPAATALVVPPPAAHDPSSSDPEADAPPEPAPDAPTVRTEDDAPGAVLLGAAAEGPHHGRRRRRSATLLPPLPAPTDIPEDAAGRVAIFAVPGPTTAPSPAGDRARTAPDITPAPVIPVGGDAPLAGWLPVLALGVVLVVAFVIGVLVTR